MSTDMYGMATLDACRQILERIEPIRKKMAQGASLKEVASAAFFERVDLSAHGFFALDDSRCGYDWAKEKPELFPDNAPQNSWKGQPFNYFTQACACTEVEIDTLTGNHRTIRSDILVDGEFFFFSFCIFLRSHHVSNTRIKLHSWPKYQSSIGHRVRFIFRFS